jgi:hypothetical protein
MNRSATVAVRKNNKQNYEISKKSSPLVSLLKPAQLPAQLASVDLFSRSFDLGAFGEAVGFHCM